MKNIGRIVALAFTICALAIQVVGSELNVASDKTIISDSGTEHIGNVTIKISVLDNQIVINSKTVQIKDQETSYSGDVEIKYSGLTIQADAITVHQQNHEMIIRSKSAFVTAAH